MGMNQYNTVQLHTDQCIAAQPRRGRAVLPGGRQIVPTADLSAPARLQDYLVNIHDRAPKQGARPCR